MFLQERQFLEVPKRFGRQLIGNDRMPVSQIDKILTSKNRDFAGPTAAPEGLYLKEVKYAENTDI